MTCNFLNNAGQDLDNLFAISNSNAGNLGFVTVDGQDLGNRYPNGSLNYAVGYQTSNGTDIGYLRAKTFPISYSSGGNGSVTTNPAYNAVPGQTVRVTATPFSGYTVQSITWNGNSIANNGTFTMPSGPVAIRATFAVIVQSDVVTFTVGAHSENGSTYYGYFRSASWNMGEMSPGNYRVSGYNCTTRDFYTWAKGSDTVQSGFGIAAASGSSQTLYNNIVSKFGRCLLQIEVMNNNNTAINSSTYSGTYHSGNGFMVFWHTAIPNGIVIFGPSNVGQQVKLRLQFV